MSKSNIKTVDTCGIIQKINVDMDELRKTNNMCFECKLMSTCSLEELLDSMKSVTFLDVMVTRCPNFEER